MNKFNPVLFLELTAPWKYFISGSLFSLCSAGTSLFVLQPVGVTKRRGRGGNAKPKCSEPSRVHAAAFLPLSPSHARRACVLLAARSPSAAMQWWRCSTRSCGSTPTSPCCPPPCSTSSAPRLRSSLACSPAPCLSSKNFPWRR